ncbi:unnamed protein product [Heterobilharzia americana]|nr:unnamed protein product [Heterobilharzia americana]
MCACDLLVDAFAGVGGNTIQFAQTCGLVLALEHCFPRLLLLQNNARIYGVLSKIMIVCGDVERVLNSLRSVSSSTDCFVNHTSNVQSSREQYTADSLEMSPCLVKNPNLNLQVNGEQSVNSPETSFVLDDDVSQSEHPHSPQVNNPEPQLQLGSDLNEDEKPILNISAEKPVTSSLNPLIDIVFMSPPWGGPGYIGTVFPPGSSSWNRRKRKHWLDDVEEIEPTKNLEDIVCLNIAMNVARHVCSRLLVYLPRNSSIGQLIQMSWPLTEGSCSERHGDCCSCKQYLNVHIETYCLRGRQLALGLYLGDFPFVEEDTIVHNKSV